MKRALPIMNSKNDESVALMKAVGWSQAETARRRRVTPAAVSHFLNGHAVTAPSPLSLLKLLVAQDQRKGVGIKHEPPAGLPAWASDLISDLEGLPKKEREELVSVFRKIARVKKRAKDAGSEQDKAAGKSEDKADRHDRRARVSAFLGWARAVRSPAAVKRTAPIFPMRPYCFSKTNVIFLSPLKELETC